MLVEKQCYGLPHRVQAPPPAVGRAVDAKTDLGKLEIKWRRSMGEVRLMLLIFERTKCPQGDAAGCGYLVPLIV